MRFLPQAGLAARGGIITRLVQPGRAQQAADVVSPEWRAKCRLGMKTTTNVSRDVHIPCVTQLTMAMFWE